MGWFRRKSGTRDSGGISRQGLQHLEQFTQTRRGVEAYTEPRTNVTEMTVVLIAYDGEWTRRVIGNHDQAAKLAARLGIPIYEVAAVGYPPRMREWTRLQRERRTSLDS